MPPHCLLAVPRWVRLRLERERKLLEEERSTLIGPFGCLAGGFRWLWWLTPSFPLELTCLCLCCSSGFDEGYLGLSLWFAAGGVGGGEGMAAGEAK